MSDAAQDGGAPPAAVAQLPTDPVVLEQEIVRRRATLAATVDELAFRTQPREILRRGLNDAARRLREATTTPDGRLRTGRVAAVGAAVVAVLVVAAWRRRSR